MVVRRAWRGGGRRGGACEKVCGWSEEGGVRGCFGERIETKGGEVGLALRLRRKRWERKERGWEGVGRRLRSPS